MLRPKYKRVVVVCPERVTGGPEALHQLAHCINHLGGDAQMAYVWPTTQANPCLQAYAHYCPTVLEGPIPDDPGVCVVYPEVMTLAARAAQGAAPHRIVWWLSVAVAADFNPALLTPEGREQFFSDPTLVHAYQSNYAGKYLAAHVHNPIPLMDYVGALYRIHSMVDAPRAQVAVYLGRNTHLLQQYMQRYPDRPYFRIGGMTPVQVIQGLRQCRVYIDFGSATGKDRVPREAALQGCVVFLHAGGANACREDHPLDPYYLFTSHDVVSGALHDKVQAVFAHTPNHYARQRWYHETIDHEPQVFERQVRTLFFHG